MLPGGVCSPVDFWISYVSLPTQPTRPTYCAADVVKRRPLQKKSWVVKWEGPSGPGKTAASPNVLVAIHQSIGKGLPKQPTGRLIMPSPNGGISPGGGGISVFDGTFRGLAGAAWCSFSRFGTRRGFWRRGEPKEPHPSQHLGGTLPDGPVSWDTAPDWL